MNLVRADQITYALGKRHKRDIFLTEVKTSSTWAGSHYRLDAVAIKPSWTQPCITIYEVKISRADFMRDEKYIGYLPHCHRLYFAAPLGIIKPDELAENIGLVTYNPETGGLRTAKKALFRPLDNLPSGLLYYLVLSRTDSDRHPFFSGVREYLEAWAQDKDERYKLAGKVRDKVQRLQGLEDGDSILECKRLEQKATELDDIHKILAEHGISKWNCREELHTRLEVGIPISSFSDIETIATISARLHEQVKEQGAGTNETKT